ncbi:hypothetical protein A2U01_0092418, partial [Trifolium medium]|nr:hypothetical protein [Trifolium medium]
SEASRKARELAESRCVSPNSGNGSTLSRQKLASSR